MTVIAEVQLIKLGGVFLVIVLILWLKRPLYQATMAALATSVLLYGIVPVEWFRMLWRVCTNWSSMSILVTLYLITFLQRMLEKRSQLKLAQEDLNNIFHNRKINAAGASFFIGLLPSAAAMIICGDIVKNATQGYMNNTEQAFTASWFRHIPESSLPTYSGVLLMCTLSGVPLSQFLVGMIVPVIVLIALGYVYDLRKLPSYIPTDGLTERSHHAGRLLRHLWTLLAILLLILLFHFPVEAAVLVVIGAAVLYYHFSRDELQPMVRSAFEMKLIGNTFLVLVLKECISYTGVFELLPEVLGQLPIPLYLIFAILFFVGSIVSGTSSIIALGTPLAFAAVPGAGMPLMVLLMCMCHAASQISPTHICLIVVTEYFDISLGALVRKTLPVSLAFGLLMIGYYQILIM